MKAETTAWIILLTAFLAIGWFIWSGLNTQDWREPGAGRSVAREEESVGEAMGEEEWFGGAEETANRGGEAMEWPSDFPQRRLQAPDGPDPSRRRFVVPVEGHAPEFPPGDYHLSWPPQVIPDRDPSQPGEAGLPIRMEPIPVKSSGKQDSASHRFRKLSTIPAGNRLDLGTALSKVFSGPQKNMHV